MALAQPPGLYQSRQLPRQTKTTKPDPTSPVIQPSATVSQLRQEASLLLAKKIAGLKLSALPLEARERIISTTSRAFWMQFDMKHGEMS